MSHNTANNWYRKYLSGPDNYEVGKKKPAVVAAGPLLSFRNRTNDCFFFDENSFAIITDAVESLTAAFEGLDI